MFFHFREKYRTYKSKRKDISVFSVFKMPILKHQMIINDKNQSVTESDKLNPNSETNFGVSSSKAEICKRVKKAVSANGGNSAVAQKSGINLKTIGNYTSGKSEPSAGKLVQIAKVCGVTIEWLATGKEPDPVINYPESELGTANPERLGLIDRKMLVDIFKNTMAAMDKHDVHFPMETIIDICITTYNSANNPDLAHLSEDERYQKVGEIYKAAFTALDQSKSD